MGVTPPVHVLVLTLPGGAPIRLSVDRALREAGWVSAWSPADADLLVVCGAAGEGDVVEKIWQQLPGPRARVHLDASAGSVPAQVGALLERAAATLRDRARQDDLSREADSVGTHDAHGGTSDDNRGSTDHGGIGRDGSGDDVMDHRDPRAGDPGGMDMSGPADIPLAGSSDDDRDGLEMDEWHVVLGAGLAAWPSGLVLRATLHGDLVTGIETLREPAGAEAAGRRPESLPTTAPAIAGCGGAAPVRPALLFDAAAAVLELAGWSSAADAARGLRDAALSDPDPARLAPVADRLVGRVSSSRALRWSLQGTRRRAAPMTPGRMVHVRLVGLLREAAALLRDPGATVPAPAPDGLATLRDLAVGQDLGTLRLLVASLALDARELERV